MHYIYMTPTSMNWLATLALKPRGDTSRSPKQEYQWHHKRTYVLQKIIKEKNKRSKFTRNLLISWQTL